MQVSLKFGFIVGCKLFLLGTFGIVTVFWQIVDENGTVASKDIIEYQGFTRFAANRNEMNIRVKFCVIQNLN